MTVMFPAARVRPWVRVPSGVQPTWCPTSLTSAVEAKPDGSDPRDGVTVQLLSEGREIDQTGKTDSRKLQYLVRGAQTLDQAIDAPGIPGMYETHPLNPWLIVKNRSGRVLPGADNIYVITVIWDYPQLGSVEPGAPKPKWSFSQSSQRVEVDLDGNDIGSRVFFDDNLVATGVIDENAEIGMDVPVPEISFELEMPGARAFDPAIISTYLMTVNDRPFFGVNAGYCLYVGPSAEWVGPGMNDYKISHAFVLGQMYIPPRFQGDAGGAYLGIEYGFWFKFKKTPTGQRQAIKLVKSRIYPRSNFDALLTLT